LSYACWYVTVYRIYSGVTDRVCTTRKQVKRGEKYGLTRAYDLQQNLQQACTFRLLSRYCYATASIISSFLAIINLVFTNTYKTLVRTVDPKVEGSSPFGLVS